MKDLETIQPKIKRASGLALAAGVGGLVLAAAGFAKVGPGQFFQSYLQAYLFWVAIPLGSLGLLMIHHLAGGGWGFLSRRIYESAIKTLPLMALLFIPVILGMNHLYAKWMRPEELPEMQQFMELIEFKSLYLNQQAFIIRNVVAFVLLSVLGFTLCAWSKKQDETGDESLNYRMRVLSGIGMLVYTILVTMACWDWTMSLEPTWFSSMWGPMFFAGASLSTFAFSIVVLARLRRYAPMEQAAKPRLFHDLGNFTFAFTILWTYMAFSQFIIIWSGNLPEETTYYLQRIDPSWKMVAVILALFNFLVPFFLLLSRFTKLQIKFLGKIALYVLVMRIVDVYWTVAPTFHSEVNITLCDLALPFGIGGIWLFAFLRSLGSGPLLPQHDPRFPLETMLKEEGGHHG